MATDDGRPELRAAGEGDFAGILALNAVEQHFTSPLDPARLRQLHGWAWRHTVAVVDDRVAAFLLTMRDGSGYDGTNFRWFAARYPRFVYVDRIVVDAYFKGHGLGGRLYRELFAAAADDGAPIVCCEYNLVPANDASRAFHDRFGFREVGQCDTADGKRVSMQVAPAPPL